MNILISLLLIALLGASGNANATPDPQKILRYAFPIAETGFDPAQVTDLYSIYVVAAIFDPPLTYDYLAKPLKLVPNTLVAMPEVKKERSSKTP